ncbi:response regulator [bacterium]|nr:response regulator [bacterium]
MKAFHRLLAEEMSRLGVEGADTSQEAWKAFARRILEVSSKEMQELYSGLASQKEKLDTIVSSVGDGLAHLDSQGFVQLLNPAGQALLGLSQEPLDQNFWELVQSPCPAAAGTWERRFMTGFVDFEASLCYRTMEPGGSVVSFRDVTEKARTLRALEEARAAAESASRTKSEFLATMSHEIRTPMNGVLGMASLLEQTHLTSEQSHYLSVIKASGETLLAIINDILDFSKIEAGKLELSMSTFDVRQVIESVTALLADHAHRKNLELAHLVYRDVPEILRGDVDRLRQILMNLLSNAIKFTHRGEVVVRVKLESAGAEEAVLRFEVSDTGIGVPGNLREQIFSAFGQADASTTRRYGGTGLGLTICKRLCELMDGQIDFHSEPGKGSTFWFTARFGRFMEPPKKGEDPTEDGLFGVRVLIIDDNETNRCVLKEHLLGWEMLAKTAADGDSGIILLRKAVEANRPFDLVLLDMQMPDKDGLDIAAEIRADSSIAEVPIVLLTSVGHREWEGRAAELKILASHSKPIRRAELYDCISQAVGRQRKAAAPSASVAAVAEIPKLAGHVLLVEDNKFNQQVAQGLLEHLGLTCKIAENGLEALEMLWGGVFDLVLMDCQMPGMDGYEATRTIRERENTSRIPIIAMTAHARQGDRELCLEAGMDDYLSKPVDLSRMAQCLSRWLDSQGPLAVPPPHARTESASPVLDPTTWSMILSIRQRSVQQGEEDLILVFLQNLGDNLHQLQRGVAHDDPVAVAEALHILQGISGNIGATELHAITVALIEQIHSQPKAALEPGLARVKGAAKRVRQSILAQDGVRLPSPGE